MSTKRLPAAERKKQILGSAIRVFARSTYHGATTKSISEEAGVTEALIYRYFGSKRKLFEEAIHHTASHLVHGLEATLEHSDNPVNAIVKCFDYYVHVLEKHEDLAKMIFLVLAELDETDIRDTYLPYQERALKALSSSITRWQERGVVRADIDPESTAWLFFGSYLILALYKHSMGAVPVDPSYAVRLASPFLNPDASKRLAEFDVQRSGGQTPQGE